MERPSLIRAKWFLKHDPAEQKFCEDLPKVLYGLEANGKYTVNQLNEIARNPPVLLLSGKTDHYTVHFSACDTQVVVLFFQKKQTGQINQLDNPLEIVTTEQRSWN